MQLDKQKIPFCIHRKTLGGGTVGRMTEIAIHDRARQAKISPFVASFLLLDSSLISKTDADIDLNSQLTKNEEFQIIWEDPCAEAFQLRHMDGFRSAKFESLESARTTFAEQFGTREVVGHYMLERLLKIQLPALWEVSPAASGFDGLLGRLGIPKLL